jgi:hypothetical protein
LIAFNLANEAAEMPDFRQELFEQAEACGPLTDPKYLQALATLQKGADVEGLRAMLTTPSVDLLFAAGNAPTEIRDPLRGDRGGEGTWPAIASAAAIAGYPSITVPRGQRARFADRHRIGGRSIQRRFAYCRRRTLSNARPAPVYHHVYQTPGNRRQRTSSR